MIGQFEAISGNLEDVSLTKTHNYFLIREAFTIRSGVETGQQHSSSFRTKTCVQQELLKLRLIASVSQTIREHASII